MKRLFFSVAIVAAVFVAVFACSVLLDLSVAAPPVAAAAAVLPLAVIPRLRKPRQHRGRGSDGLHRVYLALNEVPAAGAAAPGGGGSAGAQPAGQPATIDPATLVIKDAHGTVITGFNRAEDGSLVAPTDTMFARNASHALTLAPDVRLSNFAVGLPSDDLEAMAQFMAPNVAAALKFDFTVYNRADALGVINDDLVGLGGLPPVVDTEQGTLVSKMLQFRGAEAQMDVQSMNAYNQIPGWSADQEFQRKIMRIRNWQRRGRLQRIITAAASAAGGATGKTWDSSANPIEDLYEEISTLAILCGGRQNVRVMFGRTAWKILRFAAKLVGGTNYPQQKISKQDIADLLEIPVDNIQVSYLQIATSTQGTTTTTTDLFTAAEIYLFGCSATPNLDDPSFMKTFVMMLNGAPVYVYAWQPHVLFERRGVAYWELIAVTNASAVKRLTITSTAPGQ